MSATTEERIARLEAIILALVGDGGHRDEAVFTALALDSPLVGVGYDRNEQVHEYGPKGAWRADCWCNWSLVGSSRDHVVEESRGHARFVHPDGLEGYPHPMVHVAERDEGAVAS